MSNYCGILQQLSVYVIHLSKNMPIIPEMQLMSGIIIIKYSFTNGKEYFWSGDGYRVWNEIRVRWIVLSQTYY